MRQISILCIFTFPSQDAHFFSCCHRSNGTVQVADEETGWPGLAAAGTDNRVAMSVDYTPGVGISL